MRSASPPRWRRCKAAVKRLHDAQFIRNTEEGWKLQTAQEKNWETERRGYLDPKPRERNEITRHVLQEIFDEPEFKTYRYQELRNFRIGVGGRGRDAGDDGDLPLTLCVADDADDLPRKLDEVRDGEPPEGPRERPLLGLRPDPRDRRAGRPDFTPPARWSRSTTRCGRRTRSPPTRRPASRTRRTPCLDYESRLRDKLTEAMERGTGMFRGVSRGRLRRWARASARSSRSSSATPSPTSTRSWRWAPGRSRGTRPSTSSRPPTSRPCRSVFYDGEHGLGLVIKDGAKFVPNPAADVAKEVLDYLVSEHGYGNKDTRMGKALEKRFGGIGYGWDRDMLRLILATLVPGGRDRGHLPGQPLPQLPRPGIPHAVHQATRHSGRRCSRPGNRSA